MLVDAAEYLDAYHSIDASVAVLMRSLRDNPPQSADSDDTDDDYEDDDYYDDDYDEDEDDDSDESDDEYDDDGEEDIAEISDELEDDNPFMSKFEDYADGDDDRSEEEEDESILDKEDVDINDEGTSSNDTVCEIRCENTYYIVLHLTLSTPGVRNCCRSRGLAPYWSNPPLSQIKNGGLYQYGKVWP